VLCRLQEGGIAILSNTTLNGKLGMRAAIVNHRSSFEDFKILLSEFFAWGMK
jgi:hypothetical protein